MLDQLQVGQVGHWEYFGGRLDHSNEMQTHHPHDCHTGLSLPMVNQELQDIGSMVVAVIICHRTGILFLSCLDNFQSDRYSRMPTGSILDLKVIFWFPVNCNIHWQAMVDPMATLPIPPRHGLVHANLIKWEKFALNVH